MLSRSAELRQATDRIGWKCRLFHRWVTVERTLWLYQECSRCGSRQVWQAPCGGYQPFDRLWLETGTFFEFYDYPIIASTCR